MIPYLKEFFRRETRAVWAKRRVKGLSHVSRDSNVTLLLWSGEEGGEVGVSFTRPLSIYRFLFSNSIANLVFTSIKTILLGVTKSE